METTTPADTQPDTQPVTWTAAARALNHAEHALFSSFADPATSTDDLDETRNALARATHKPLAYIDKGIFAYTRLHTLPRLRDLQDTTTLLDLDRLAAIDRALNPLSAHTTAADWARIDDFLTELLTTRRPGTALPSARTITKRLQKLLTDIDATIGYDIDARDKRRNNPGRRPTVAFYPTEENGHNRLGMEATADAATMTLIRTRIKDTARHHKLSMADATIKLLTGDISTNVKTILHIYTPKNSNRSDGASDESNSAPMYLPGVGWADSDAATTLHNLINSTRTTTNDLDTAARAHTTAYTPTPAMAAYVRARDGACIHPGCHRPAETCQIDHRIPHNQNGPTTPDNLYCLCAYHHNQKTDRRSYYIPDPATGEAVWLYSDGTWAIAEDKGILHEQISPTNPRWARTIADHQSHRARHARFHAACHKLCDDYDSTGDLDTCINGIRELEKEYGLTFDFTPEPEPISHHPTPPWDPSVDLCEEDVYTAAGAVAYR